MCYVTGIDYFMLCANAISWNYVGTRKELKFLLGKVILPAQAVGKITNTNFLIWRYL